jgi:hypothetical protein
MAHWYHVLVRSHKPSLFCYLGDVLLFGLRSATGQLSHRDFEDCMSKPDKQRVPPVRKQVTELSNSELVVIAAFRAGAAGLHADTEDIAVKANEIGPGRFTWKKYQEQINIDTVRKRLWDARKRGHLVGSERDGWLLTETGTTFARQYRRLLGAERTTRLSLNERKWRRMEKVRLLTTRAHLKFRSGEMSSITAREAQGFFRIDAYVSKSTIENKILRILNAFSVDHEIGPTVKYVASLVRRADVIEDHLR